MKAAWWWALVLVGCGGCGGGVVDEPLPPEPEPCTPAPLGFIVWQSGDTVMVSKPLHGTIMGGIEQHAEIHPVAASALPAEVDFGAELIQVRADMSLCLIER
jgi:hypothetical protein